MLKLLRVAALLMAAGNLAAVTRGMASPVIPDLEPDCSRRAGSLPDPGRPAGTMSPDNPIKHIIVLMQENRSFDHYFGRLNAFGYRGQVDGLDESMVNFEKDGTPVHPFHEKNYCDISPMHGWNAMHLEWNGGRNDRFAEQSGRHAMGYFEKSELGYYYDLANRFAVGDRYFSSVLGPTFPNRFYSLTGTSFGHLRNTLPHWFTQFSQKTIFDVLNFHGVRWKLYFTQVPSLGLFFPDFVRNLGKLQHISRFARDLKNGRLPPVVFLETNFVTEDEHPGADFQVGQQVVARRIRELMNSRYWDKSVFFLTYDEAGGYFDHVAPPRACIPDAIKPKLRPEDIDDQFDRYGFRVPFLAVSPFVKKHYVSHQVYDHTSILKFIETVHNLPALTRRDANADAMADLFDFAHPDFSIPVLEEPRVDEAQLRRCLRHRKWFERGGVDEGDEEEEQELR